MVYRSRRVPADLSHNRLAEARANLGEIPFDLTTSNPSACGLPYPADLLSSLADSRGLSYEPDPRGPLEARRVIAAQYEEWSTSFDPDRVVMTASTSEAYSYLFRLFCNPDDAILVPSPSYPLFAHLAALDGIEAAAYRLDHEVGWRIDFSSLEKAIDKVRAVVVVHPNNPTGSFVHPADRERLIATCRDRDWAIIADEVFLPYPLEGGPGQDTTFATVDGCLCCTLGGLSKSLGLPQLKLAWMLVTGPDERVEPVLDGLDYVADAYLSVSTPSALALASLFARGRSVSLAILERCRANLSTLRELVSGHPEVSVGPVAGGWSAVVRVPSVLDDEELCLKLLVDRGLAVHPGGPFGFPGQGWLSLSLLPPSDVFSMGSRLMLDTVAETITPRSG
jgi:aspartate/methionine/tyrosine aminotransferase